MRIVNWLTIWHLSHTRTHEKLFFQSAGTPDVIYVTLLSDCEHREMLTSVVSCNGIGSYIWKPQRPSQFASIICKPSSRAPIGQLDRLENISIALDSAEEEQALRNISAKSSRLDKQDAWGPSPARDFQARR
jgi:hypothetical protein